ncbi:MAG TPA: hypothetical protein DCP67_07425 [Planctomycetaceae bacterium]|nr:hypothetical protein [Planctomycetaceae bacterium]
MDTPIVIQNRRARFFAETFGSTIAKNYKQASVIANRLQMQKNCNKGCGRFPSRPKKPFLEMMDDGHRKAMQHWRNRKKADTTQT